MANTARHFRVDRPAARPAPWADAVILLGIAALMSGALFLAFEVPRDVRGPEISLSPAALPWYAALSLGPLGVEDIASTATSSLAPAAIFETIWKQREHTQFVPHLKRLDLLSEVEGSDAKAVRVWAAGLRAFRAHIVLRVAGRRRSQHDSDRKCGREQTSTGN
jgi:hypothetical protein